MNQLRFTKMHGLGNDFIVIDAASQPLNWHQFPFSAIADRHLGVGCDQILLIEQSSNADYFCRIINADGSEAEQCGNGLRCVARFLHEKGLHASHRMTIETIVGVFPVEIKDYDHIRVTIPSASIESSTLHLQIPTLGKSINGSALSVGNPHFIVKVDNIKDTDTRKIGAAISTHPDFPNGTNVGFMQIINSNHVRLCTYERGAGETNACGSNACAAVAAGIIDGSLKNTVNVEFKYGQLIIEWQGKGEPVYMTGPAVSVFEGALEI